ncbi:hypothetical protein HDU97_001538 [Phlyctochytrium planicorne]|nr:hypothetical protein HDU97_001538 [Phlyctochytrium planicorne]
MASAIVIPASAIKIDTSKPLGSGASGVVYKASYGNDTVVVKRLKVTSLSEKAEEEFKQEVSTLAKLNHPRIVRLLGVVIENQYSIVLEYLRLGSLYSFYTSAEKIPFGNRLSLAMDIATGMEFLHKANPQVLHRDMKSLNILLYVDNAGELHAKITDFGISLVLQGTMTMTTAQTTSSSDSQKGTLIWMSPELFSLRAIYRPSCDVYSFGVVLSELFSWAGPFGIPINELRYEVLQHHLTVKKEVPEVELDEDHPNAALLALVAKCVSYEPSERPEFTEIVEKLREIMDSEEAPVPASELNLEQTQDLTKTVDFDVTETSISQRSEPRAFSISDSDRGSSSRAFVYPNVATSAASATPSPSYNSNQSHGVQVPAPIKVDAPAPSSPYIYQQTPAAPQPAATFANAAPSFAPPPTTINVPPVFNAEIPPVPLVPQPFPVELANESSAAPQKRTSDQAKQRRMWTIVVIVVVIIAIGAGVGIGLYVSGQNKGGDGSSGSSNQTPAPTRSTTTSAKGTGTGTATATSDTDAPAQTTQPAIVTFKIKLDKSGQCMGPDATLVDCSSRGTDWKDTTGFSSSSTLQNALTNGCLTLKATAGGFTPSGSGSCTNDNINFNGLNQIVDKIRNEGCISAAGGSLSFKKCDSNDGDQVWSKTSITTATIPQPTPAPTGNFKIKLKATGTCVDNNARLGDCSSKGTDWKDYNGHALQNVAAEQCLTAKNGFIDGSVGWLMSLAGCDLSFAYFNPIGQIVDSRFGCLSMNDQQELAFRSCESSNDRFLWSRG